MKRLSGNIKKDKKFSAQEKKLAKGFASAFRDIELSIAGKKKLKV